MEYYILIIAMHIMDFIAEVKYKFNHIKKFINESNS